ncbi:MAG: bacillithiol biosynthesis cysteine-adding enzyme BshC [Bacteroidetes bacterium]|nr:bacillithiol biosynthesis cysteine-adding enzyme BshC [Bacteroidota bacterium]
MIKAAEQVAYPLTGYFSNLVSDYLEANQKLTPFYTHTPDIDGVKAAIAARDSFNTPRIALVNALNKQYETVKASDLVTANIQSLANSKTYTVTTAHQPNLFTGPLYFIYKIAHTIALSRSLEKQVPSAKFVPVYYMGSEDADLDELGFVNIGGQKLVWQTKQTGAVGRMLVDAELLSLIKLIEGQIGVSVHGVAWVGLLKQTFTIGKTIAQATLEIVHHLFGDYGLVVVQPDSPELKSLFTSVIEKELTTGFSNNAVQQTIKNLSVHYKVQAAGRAINLFYLQGNKRERIVQTDAGYEVTALGLSFTKDQILADVQNNPANYSPNVIFRGVFQETILPNVAFIGGGGELAYWLELKQVFADAAVPFPVLLLRNSFLLVPAKQALQLQKMHINTVNLFKGRPQVIIDSFVKANSVHHLQINTQMAAIEAQYALIKEQAAAIDASLVDHIEALSHKQAQKLLQVQKKMLRAEKRKYEAEQQQITKIMEQLFPGGSLQERTENIADWYKIYGTHFVSAIVENSDDFSKGFTLLYLND